jgi:ribose/xylose/arabinose/galactoside ABC-type transport system permease subunit
MAEIIEKPKPLSDTARGIAKRFFRHENAVLGIVLIALIGALAGVTKGLTFTRANMTNVLLQSSIRGVASVGQAFVILTTGIDVSVGGVGLVSSLLGASLMTKDIYLNIVGHPVSMYLGMLVMLMVGASWGVINGLSVSRIGMPPLIVTLAMWQVTTGVARQICGGMPFTEQPAGLSFLGAGKVAGVPVPVIVFVAVAVVGYFVLNHTPFGRAVYAVGGNPLSAWLSGINVRNIQFTVYIISGFLAGLAAIINLGRIMSASMQTLAGLELDTIAAVSVGGVSLTGGRGSVIGVVIGVLIIGVVSNAMGVLGAGPATQGIARGSIIISAVAIDYIRRR